MRGGIRGVMVVGWLATFVVGCATESGALEVERAERAPVFATPAPSSPADPSPLAPPPASSPNACSPQVVDALPIGSACAPIGPGAILCETPAREGWVYACEANTRPSIDGCVEYLTAEESGEGRTVVLCPSPTCVSYARDDSCGSEKPIACPKTIFAPEVEPPSPKCHELGSWQDFGSSGPLFCCP